MSLEGTQTFSWQAQKQNLLAPLNNEPQMATQMAEMGNFFPCSQDFIYVPWKKAPRAASVCLLVTLHSPFTATFLPSTIIMPPGPDLLASLCIVSVRRGTGLV